MQKKTFTKWVNSHLSRVGCKIQDLYVDLRDGKMLIKLLEVLSGERLVCVDIDETDIFVSHFLCITNFIICPFLYKLLFCWHFKIIVMLFT